jgi:peroxiredoxin
MSSSKSGTDTRASRADWVVLLLLGLSLVGNISLGVAVLRFSGQQAPAQASRAARDQPPPPPKVGETLPALEAHRFGGPDESMEFGSGQRPTVFYVFSPDCKWCARNLDNVRQVVSAAKDTHRIVGISLDPEVGEYLNRVRFDFPVYVKPSAAVFTAYRLGPTPLTLVVSPEGKVLKSWVGAYLGDSKKEVEEYFKVKLPGVSKPG